PRAIFQARSGSRVSLEGCCRRPTQRPRSARSSSGFYDSPHGCVQRAEHFEVRAGLGEGLARRVFVRYQDSAPAEFTRRLDVAELVADVPAVAEIEREIVGRLAEEQGPWLAAFALAGDVRVMRAHIRRIDARAIAGEQVFHAFA